MYYKRDKGGNSWCIKLYVHKKKNEGEKERESKKKLTSTNSTKLCYKHF